MNEISLKENGNILDKITFNIGFLLLLFVITNIVTTTFLQFLSIPMTKINIIISSIVTIIEYLVLSRKSDLKNINKFIIVIMSIILVIFSSYFMGKTYDFTSDGNAYHKTAIGDIKLGWNPVKESSYEFNKKNGFVPLDEKISLWMDHYPKATWTFAASFYAITQNIETGKCIFFILMASATLMLYGYLARRHIKKWQAIIVSLCLALNPIALAQMFSYYVDSIIGFTIYIIVLFLIMINDKKFTDITELQKWIGLASAITICINIKFTGLIFAGVFCIVFYIYWLIKNKDGKNFKNVFSSLTIIFASIVIFAIGVVGYSTYIKNILEHENPLYPLIGKDKVDIISTMQPASFINKNPIEKLLISIFSNTDNIAKESGKMPKIKIPFSINKNELTQLGIPDARIGGYGVLFSAIFTISIFLFISFMIIGKKDKNIIDIPIYVCIFIGIIIIVLLPTEAWWARYAPQLYLIPIMALIAGFKTINDKYVSKKETIIIILCIFIVTIAINSALFMDVKVRDLRKFQSLSKDLYFLKQTYQNETVEIYMMPKDFYGILFNLKDKKINARYVLELTNKSNLLYDGTIKY